MEQLRLRGGVSVFLSEGRWFDSPGLHVEVSLGKDAEPQTAPDAGRHLAWKPPPSVYECMYELL